MGPEGLEQSGLEGAGGPISGEGGAKCGAHPDVARAPTDATGCDAQLGRLARLWPSLPADVRDAVLILVESSERSSAAQR